MNSRMKRIYCILAFCAVCMSASAVNYHIKYDYLFNRGYYNPAVSFFGEGIFVNGAASYDLNYGALSGKEPLDINADLLVNRKNYSAFASISHTEYSYFCSMHLNAGYSHSFEFGDHSIKVGGRLNLGLNSIDFSHLTYESPVEDGKSRLIPTPDFDLGFEYSFKGLHIGVSMKNVLELDTKFKGVTYVTWPRGYMIDIMYDARMAQDNVRIQPFFMFGFNQSMMFHSGVDLTLWKNYRLSYSFHGLDFFNNISASIMICDRVCLNGGYSFSYAHNYSYAHCGITVRLAR